MAHLLVEVRSTLVEQSIEGYLWKMVQILDQQRDSLDREFEGLLGVHQKGALVDPAPGGAAC
jgi:hypothetical protein